MARSLTSFGTHKVSSGNETAQMSANPIEQKTVCQCKAWMNLQLNKTKPYNIKMHTQRKETTWKRSLFIKVFFFPLPTLQKLF